MIFIVCSCGHCHRVSGKLIEVANTGYTLDDHELKFSAVDCDASYGLCSRMKITGVPTLLIMNLYQNGEVDDFMYGISETQVMDSITKSIRRKLPRFAFTHKDTRYVSKDKQGGVVAVSNNTALNRLLDAGTAVVYAFKYAVPFGVERIADERLEALKNWLYVLSVSFPGQLNRWLLKQLHEQVVRLHSIEVKVWQKMVEDWQTLSYNTYEKHGDKYQTWETGAIPSTMFDHKEYRVCKGYTCGQWFIFHMLTETPKYIKIKESIPKLATITLSVYRQFMTHFFRCHECTQHFLQVNTIEKVNEISAATFPIKKLSNWMQEFHNQVNVRLHKATWNAKPLDQEYGYADHIIESHGMFTKWLQWVSKKLDKPRQVSIYPVNIE